MFQTNLESGFGHYGNFLRQHSVVIPNCCGLRVMEEATTPTPFLLNDAVVQVVEEQLR
jgi:hypothetical protein